MWSFLDKAYKILVNKRATSTLKKPHEEFGDFTLDVSASEVKARPIAINNPGQAVTDGVAQLYTLFVLTEDVTVASNQSWFAFQSGNRLKNWISDKYGTNYLIKLFDNSGNQIFTTDASDWTFDYVTGILNFSGDVSAFPKPFKVTGYRYIGQYLDTFSAAGRLLKYVIPISSNGQTSFNLATALPGPFDEIFDVIVNGISLKSTEWNVLASTLTFIEGTAGFSLAITDELQVQYYSA